MLGEVRDPDCTKCKMHRTADQVCVTGTGPRDADIMVIGKMPDSKKYRLELAQTLADQGIPDDRIFFTSAIKCRTFDQDPSNADVKVCRQYLEAEIDLIKPKHLLVMGNEALLATTGHSGIMKYKGRVIDKPEYDIVPTVSPSAVKRNPGQMQSWLADLRLFANRVHDRAGGVQAPKVALIDSKARLKVLLRKLASAEHIFYDIETNGSEEYKDDARMVSLCATMRMADGSVLVWALPLFHPESPFQSTWRSVLRVLGKYWPTHAKQTAHNGKFDARWLRQFGVPASVTDDTMLAAHILDENRQKGLKPQAMSRLGVEPWAMDTGSLLTQPLKLVLKYNVLDTWYMSLIYDEIMTELEAAPRRKKIYREITIPANEALIDIERHGVWIDVDRLKKRKPTVIAELERIHTELMAWVPDPDETEDWPRMGKKGKLAEVNFNATKWCRWWLFEYLGLPVLARGKLKADGSEGDPSMSEDVLQHLKDEHPAVPWMLERVKWNKYLTSFFNAYEELYDDEHRIHTTFKLTGTVTGRLSSGKADADKLTGSRGKLRGVNLQQVPRDPLVRGLFGAPPGWWFLEFDFSQIELRLVAYIARVERMLRAYQLGEDIHELTAMQVTGLPASQITKEIRKKVGKPVNFGFIYGMYPKKFIDTAFNNYGAVFSMQEATAYRKRFFDGYPELQHWHNRQRRLVEKYARVQSPLGRVRHLPDIRSGDEKVRMEAQRQAINSPVQGMASDMTQLAMVLALRQIKADGMDGVVRCLGSVHDALNWEVRDDAVDYALPLIKHHMENLPFGEFGVDMDVPILADAKIGHHWGDAIELEDFTTWRDQLEGGG